MKEQKPIYKLRLNFKEDLKPFFGLKNYLERCLEEMEIKHLRGQNTTQYEAESWIRSSALAVYNLTILGLTTYGILEGISKLLEK